MSKEDRRREQLMLRSVLGILYDYNIFTNAEKTEFERRIMEMPK